jgi:hypothetical protein
MLLAYSCFGLAHFGLAQNTRPPANINNPIRAVFPRKLNWGDLLSLSGLLSLSFSPHLTCSTTRLVVEQVLHFFGLKPYKNAFYKEVVQKLKFLNNSIQSIGTV